MDEREGVHDAAYVDGFSAFDPDGWDSGSDLTDLEDEGEVGLRLQTPPSPGPTTSPIQSLDPATPKPTAEDLERALAKLEKNRKRRKRRRDFLEAVRSGKRPQVDGVTISAGDVYGRTQNRLLEKAARILSNLKSKDLPHSTKGYLGGSTNRNKATLPPKSSQPPHTSWPDLQHTATDDPRRLELEDLRDRAYSYGTAQDV